MFISDSMLVFISDSMLVFISDSMLVFISDSMLVSVKNSLLEFELDEAVLLSDSKSISKSFETFEG